MIHVHIYTINVLQTTENLIIFTINIIIVIMLYMYYSTYKALYSQINVLLKVEICRNQLA